jgi:hypothetical protein
VGSGTGYFAAVVACRSNRWMGTSEHHGCPAASGVSRYGMVPRVAPISTPRMGYVHVAVAIYLPQIPAAGAISACSSSVACCYLPPPPLLSCCCLISPTTQRRFSHLVCRAGPCRCAASYLAALLTSLSYARTPSPSLFVCARYPASRRRRSAPRRGAPFFQRPPSWSWLHFPLPYQPAPRREANGSPSLWSPRVAASTPRRPSILRYCASPNLSPPVPIFPSVSDPRAVLGRRA